MKKIKTLPKEFAWMEDLAEKEWGWNKWKSIKKK